MVPLHVKLVSILSSTIFLLFAMRNIFSPEKPIPILPDNDPLQAFAWPFAWGYGDVDRSQVYLSNIIGFLLLYMVVTKLVAVFSVKEGTFLRRNMLAAIGILDVLFGVSMYARFESDLNASRSSLQGLTLVFTVEGIIYLHDAKFRARPVKHSFNGDGDSFHKVKKLKNKKKGKLPINQRISHLVKDFKDMISDSNFHF